MSRKTLELLVIVSLVFGMAVAQDTKEAVKKDSTEREKFDPARDPAIDVPKSCRNRDQDRPAYSP